MEPTPPPTDEVIETVLTTVTASGILLASGLVGALVAYLGIRLLIRVRRGDLVGQRIIDQGRFPATILIGTVTALGVLQSLDLDPIIRGRTGDALTIAVIIALTATLLRIADAVEVAVVARYDIDADDASDDSAQARGRVTRTTIARRLFSGVILVGAVGSVLLLFDDARSLGQSLLASAGIIGLVAGVAAQSTLANVVAGVQLAVAEPMTLNDVVVVEGQWGNVEQITLTHVVIRTWDRRRLVLPTSYFVSTPFENWSRNGSQVIGTIVWQLDYRTPVALLREEYHRQVAAHPKWDGDISVLQVTDTSEGTMTVRGLVTAANSWEVWDVRCAVREGVIAWLAGNHPESLPATRLLEATRGRAPKPGEDLSGSWTTSPGLESEPDPQSRPDADRPYG